MLRIALHIAFTLYLLVNLQVPALSQTGKGSPREVTFEKEGGGASEAERGTRSLLRIIYKLMEWVAVAGAIGILYQFFRDNHQMMVSFIKGWAVWMLAYFILKALVS